MFQIILFIAILTVFSVLLFTRIRRIMLNIRIGRPLELKRDPKFRWKTVLLVAFGQKKMFMNWPVAVLHFILYSGFIIINIEILEFMIDGFSGNHRFFAGILNPVNGDGNAYSKIYNIIINIFEFFALATLIACSVFLVRRNILKTNRFKGIEMKRWPLLDANLILIFEILLMTAILSMNAADQLLQESLPDKYVGTGSLWVSRLLIVPLLGNLNDEVLVITERFFWWFHISGILGFAVYITYSKHLHIILAFPNTYFSKIDPPAAIDNMNSITREAQNILGIEVTENSEAVEPLSRFGARDVTDLTWKNLLEAYTCTECGRCTAVCPAHITGKRLSPRKIMMDVRDRMEEVGRNNMQKTSGTGETKTLLNDYITIEELFACTTCNACTSACPVNIDPVSVIIQMRRYLVLEDSKAPQAWNTMFVNIETNFAPWKIAPSDRFAWADEFRNK